MQAHTNKRTTKQDPGFPLTLSPTFVIGETGGHDKGDPAGMTEGTRRYDREARQAGQKGILLPRPLRERAWVRGCQA